MSTIIIALLAFVGYLVAYFTYGRWLARKIFRLDPDALVPSQEFQDDVDYVPTPKSVVFGHHFTSIAGTGPIVGPAIAVIWGWLPALLWVFFGCIFIGAVHDFSTLVISLRHKGKSIGDVAGEIVSPRARILFLLILSFALCIVIAVFGLVIASLFKIYPQSVFPVWMALPCAVVIGFYYHRRHGAGLLAPSLMVLVLLYVFIGIGAYWLPIQLPDQLLGGQLPESVAAYTNPVVVWTVILLVYCFIASVLPVWCLLQPRDYINSHQLIVALFLLMVGIFIAGIYYPEADLVRNAPALVHRDDLPPIFPILFITIACGAISGFHCLVATGTTSKQVLKESDARAIGYGGMLMEGVLATMVILACCAGIGMGTDVKIAELAKVPGLSAEAGISPEDDLSKEAPPIEVEMTPGDGETPNAEPQTVTSKEGTVRLTGSDAWKSRYSGGWNDFTLGQKVGVFVDGGANFLSALGLPLPWAIGIMAVLVASFAATTLDTSTRLQRYVLQEIGSTHGLLTPLKNKYFATTLAVVTAGAIAILPGSGGVPGTGGLIIWPLFGSINQLLAGLSFLVILCYLMRKGWNVKFVIVPLLLLLILPAWAMTGFVIDWLGEGDYLLAGIGIASLLLEAWMIVEGVLLLRRLKEESLLNG